jgi:hypothetical protein
MTAMPRTAELGIAPHPGRDPGTQAQPLAAVRIRRCTFRRLIAVDRAGGRVYDVDCLYPERSLPLPIGDLETATPICNACTALHIFRADED